MQILSNSICLKCTRIAEIFASFRKSGLMNTMMTSDYRPEVEIQPFRACGHKYRNSSLIVDVAMGQIPRFTERISSSLHFHYQYECNWLPGNIRLRNDQLSLCIKWDVKPY